MKILFDFFNELRTYKHRSFVYLLITIVVSVLISFITWWFQQQTIHDLRVKLLTNQTNLQSQISSVEKSSLSVPELQEITLNILERIESKIDANDISYDFDSFDFDSFLSNCEKSDVSELEFESANYFQPFYSDLNLEPILIINKLGYDPELVACFNNNSLELITLNQGVSFLIPRCYLEDLENPTNQCGLFVKKAFLSTN